MTKQSYTTTSLQRSAEYDENTGWFLTLFFIFLFWCLVSKGQKTAPKIKKDAPKITLRQELQFSLGISIQKVKFELGEDIAVITVDDENRFKITPYCLNEFKRIFNFKNISVYMEIKPVTKTTSIGVNIYDEFQYIITDEVK